MSCFTLTFRPEVTGIAVLLVGVLLNVDIHVEKIVKLSMLLLAVGITSQTCLATTIDLAWFSGMRSFYVYPIALWLVIDGLGLRAHVSVPVVVRATESKYKNTLRSGAARVITREIDF